MVLRTLASFAAPSAKLAATLTRPSITTGLESAYQRGQNHQKQKHKEERSRDFGGRSGESRESENSRDDRENQKGERPFQHLGLPPKTLVSRTMLMRRSAVFEFHVLLLEKGHEFLYAKISENLPVPVQRRRESLSRFLLHLRHR